MPTGDAKETQCKSEAHFREGMIREAGEKEGQVCAIDNDFRKYQHASLPSPDRPGMTWSSMGSQLAMWALDVAERIPGWTMWWRSTTERRAVRESFE